MGQEKTMLGRFNDIRSFLIAALLFLVGCMAADFDASYIDSNSEYEYLGGYSDRGNYSNDPYKIIAVTPGEEEWEVIVEYSGGCSDHLFYFWWDGEVNEENARSVYIIHNGGLDECDGTVRDTVSLEMFQIYDDFSEYPVVSIVNESETVDQRIAVDTRLEAVASLKCKIPASLSSGKCENGLYGQKWFQYTDTLADYREVWFQPVRASNGITFTEFEDAESVKIGGKMLFGFEYTFNEGLINTDCESEDGVLVIPFAITCLSKGY